MHEYVKFALWMILVTYVMNQQMQTCGALRS